MNTFSITKPTISNEQPYDATIQSDFDKEIIGDPVLKKDNHPKLNFGPRLNYKNPMALQTIHEKPTGNIFALNVNSTYNNTNSKYDDKFAKSNNKLVSLVTDGNITAGHKFSNTVITASTDLKLNVYGNNLDNVLSKNVNITAQTKIDNHSSLGASINRTKTNTKITPPGTYGTVSNNIAIPALGIKIPVFSTPAVEKINIPGTQYGADAYYDYSTNKVKARGGVNYSSTSTQNINFNRPDIEIPTKVNTTAVYGVVNCKLTKRLDASADLTLTKRINTSSNSLTKTISGAIGMDYKMAVATLSAGVEITKHKYSDLILDEFKVKQNAIFLKAAIDLN